MPAIRAETEDGETYTLKLTHAQLMHTHKQCHVYMGICKHWSIMDAVPTSPAEGGYLEYLTESCLESLVIYFCQKLA